MALNPQALIAAITRVGENEKRRKFLALSGLGESISQAGIRFGNNKRRKEERIDDREFQTDERIAGEDARNKFRQVEQAQREMDTLADFTRQAGLKRELFTAKGQNELAIKKLEEQGKAKTALAGLAGRGADTAARFTSKGLDRARKVKEADRNFKLKKDTVKALREETRNRIRAKEDQDVKNAIKKANAAATTSDRKARVRESELRLSGINRRQRMLENKIEKLRDKRGEDPRRTKQIEDMERQLDTLESQKEEHFGVIGFQQNPNDPTLPSVANPDGALLGDAMRGRDG